MKKLIIALLVIGGIVLVGCSTADVEKADSIEDIVGTWKRVGGSSGSYCRYLAEGTFVCDQDLERVNNNTGGFEGKYRFEGTQYFDEIPMCQEDGIYEILLLESGNLKYVLIEDECEARVLGTTGVGSIEIEWEPVP